MIRFSLKNIQGLQQNLRIAFSTRTVGNFEFHDHDSFTKVVLNRPKALNSLNTDMIKTLKN